MGGVCLGCTEQFGSAQNDLAPNDCGRCQAGVGHPGRPPYVTPRGSAGGSKNVLLDTYILFLFPPAPAGEPLHALHVLRGHVVILLGHGVWQHFGLFQEFGGCQTAPDEFNEEVRSHRVRQGLQGYHGRLGQDPS